MLGDLANLHSDWWFLNVHCTKRTLYNCTSRTYFTLEDLKHQLSQYDNFKPQSCMEGWPILTGADGSNFDKIPPPNGRHSLNKTPHLDRKLAKMKNDISNWICTTRKYMGSKEWLARIWALSSLVSSQTTWCPPKCFTQWPMSPQAQPCPSWCQGRSCSNVRENEKHASAVPSWAPW